MKLIDALGIIRQAPPDAKPFRIFLACGFEALHLRTFLTAHLQTLLPNRRAEVETGLFGDLAANIGRIEEFRGDGAAVIVEWQDLDPRLGIRRLGGWGPKELEDICDNAQRQASRIREHLLGASAHFPLAISFPTLPLPPISFTPSWQASQFDLQLRGQASALASWAARQNNSRVVNEAILRRDSGLPASLDVQSEILSGFPYPLAFASRLAEALAHLIHNRIPKKGLITDLDDTLWSGILGEVGMEGISWDLDHHSHMHGLYQQMLLALSQEGVLLGAASKNDPSVVEDAFRSGRLILPEKHVFPIEASWGPKSESVTRILRAWNVAADSVVFIDDSPMELAEVKSVHPSIECILFPKDNYKAIYELLERLRDLFGKETISEEDSIRLDSLRRAQTLRGKVNNPVSLIEFLHHAEAKLELDFCKAPPDPRALELVNKTNQFNLNGKRQTETTWQTYLKNPESFLLVAAYQDKYGPLGKITVIAGKTGGKTLQIDFWVMSCRAFSRQIEHSCLAHLLQKFGAEEAILAFEASPKNTPFRDFLSYFSATPCDSGFRISKETFAQKCPPLYHSVQELKDE